MTDAVIPDTPEKAYWLGYISQCGQFDAGFDQMLVASNEEGHLDSLEEVLPAGSMESIDVVDGAGGRIKTYCSFILQGAMAEQVFKGLEVTPVRKFARHRIRGMMDARPVFRWEETCIDTDLSLAHARYTLDYMPYFRSEHLSEERVRLYTCTEYETHKVMRYLYSDAEVFKPSRRSVYDDA